MHTASVPTYNSGKYGKYASGDILSFIGSPSKEDRAQSPSKEEEEKAESPSKDNRPVPSKVK